MKHFKRVDYCRLGFFSRSLIFAVGLQSAKITRPQFSMFFFTVMYLIVMREHKTPQFEKRLKPRIRQPRRKKIYSTHINYYQMKSPGSITSYFVFKIQIKIQSPTIFSFRPFLSLLNKCFNIYMI